MILDVLLVIFFIIFFLLGFYIIYRQVALVKKGEFAVKDRFQCIIYGFIFGMAVLVVIAMAFIFTIKTPEFWQGSGAPPPEINPYALFIPFIICVVYISIYPLIDFLFIALSVESDEGLTPFHNLIGKRIINIFNNRSNSIILAIALYLIFIIPPFILSVLGLPFIMILISWMLVYPLMILTFYGSKGYIAGISNWYYNIPDMKRSIFLNFEDIKGSLKQFISHPGPYILLGLMLFVFVWAWISMIQTIAFFYTGSMAIPTMTSVFVFVTLFLGIMGYFTRFWGRKVKYRGIDIYFAAYLMAALGINVLVNFLILNPEKLIDVFNLWTLTSQIVPNYRMFAWAAVIEEISLIAFTSYYFLAKNNEFVRNIKYSKINECGQNFNPIPLITLIKNRNPEIRKHAEETLILMFERIPLKTEIDLNDWKFKNALINGVSDPDPNSKRICYQILVQLERDIPDLILSWITESLKSPNYDKSVPFARSLLDSGVNLIEKIPESIFFNFLEDPEWRLKTIGLKIISKLIERNRNLILNLNINKIVNDPNSQVQVEILNLLAKSSVVLPVEIIIDKLKNNNKEIRAAAIKNATNLKVENNGPKIIPNLISFTRDPNATVRASIFEIFAKMGHFENFSVPISLFLEGLSDLNKEVRNASVLALERYFTERPELLEIDVIINKIDPNNNEVLSSVLTLLGRFWDKNPEKILTTLLIFVKFENEQLKQNISKILVDKYDTHPDLIVQNLIKLQDVSKFISKGIISSTLIRIAKRDPKNMIPKLISFLESDNYDIRLNAIVSLEGLIEEFPENINIKSFITLLQKDKNKQIKKEALKVVSKIAKMNPMSIKPFIPIILQSINDQESSVKIILSKSLLDIANESPEIVPIKPIIDFLSDKDPFIRESGAKLLGLVGSEQGAAEIVDALINKGLKDNEWIVREASVVSLGQVIELIENKELIVNKLVSLLDDEQSWVRRSAINIISNIKSIKASQIPFKKVLSNLRSPDAKVREASSALLKIYSFINIDRVFDKILMLLDDESEAVRKSMINVMVEITQNIGLSRILSNLLKNLSDKSSMELQRSISLILRRVARNEDIKTKKRIIAILKIRCEMSQDPIICETLQQLKES